MPDVKHTNEKTTEMINNNFVYHCPPASVRMDFFLLRNLGKDLASLINDVVPDGREKSLAITKIEEAIMWANAGIARQFKAE